MTYRVDGKELGDISAEQSMLLGTVGWQRDDWLESYYPIDLPSDWRLAYYANDCGCVLLPAETWCDAAPDLLAESLDEVGAHLQFFLMQPLGRPPDGCGNLALFGPKQAILLVDRPDPVFSLMPQWVAQGTGQWVDTESQASLLKWSLDVIDLRGLRRRAEALPATVRALVLDGAAGNPGRIPELRTLLELIGKA